MASRQLTAASKASDRSKALDRTDGNDNEERGQDDQARQDEQYPAYSGQQRGAQRCGNHGKGAAEALSNGSADFPAATAHIAQYAMGHRQFAQGKKEDSEQRVGSGRYAGAAIHPLREHLQIPYLSAFSQPAQQIGHRDDSTEHQVLSDAPFVDCHRFAQDQPGGEALAAGRQPARGGVAHASSPASASASDRRLSRTRMPAARYPALP